MRVFLEKLDARSEMPEPGKKALLRRKKSGAQVSQQKRTRGEELLRHGYLPADRRWSEATLRNRRGYVAAAAKALFSDSGYL